ncbi:MAG TPA: CPBP family intramembrane glutamic endopeptidase [Xanthomonadaceae bacterium]|nr:CPBP family intramembrane glutamic endopeptidase [Xanthomonadaceae bacterium]
MRALRPVALAALGVVLAWLLSWFVVEGLLAARARDDLAAYAGGGSPWHWSLDRPGDLVRPGSQGIDDAVFRDGALSLTVEGHAGLSLNLRGRELPLRVLDTVEIGIRADAPLRVRLDVTPAAGSTAVAVAVATLAPGAGRLTLRFADAAPARATALTLQLLTDHRTGVYIEEVRFVPAPWVDPPGTVCHGTRPARTSAERCRDPVPIVRAAAFVRVESLLAWRDDLLSALPAAIVVPRHHVPGRARMYAGTRNGPVPWVLLGVGAIALARAAWRRIRRAPPGHQGLAFWLLPGIALFALGYPGVETQWPVVVAFAAILAAALLNPSDAGPMRLSGSARAWLRALVLTAAGLALIVAAVGFVAARPEWPGWPPGMGGRLGRYALWAALQQVLLLHAIVPPLRARTGSATVACVVAGIAFGLLHTPNFALMLCTMTAGMAWAWLGLRERAVLPLVCSHIVLGSAMLLLLPSGILRSAEVGGRFLIPAAY